jgi:hypothetical protein
MGKIGKISKKEKKTFLKILSPMKNGSGKKRQKVGGDE